MLKIRRSHDRLIFNMRIPIPGKDDLYIETGPSTLALELLQSSTKPLICNWSIIYGFVKWPHDTGLITTSASHYQWGHGSVCVASADHWICRIQDFTETSPSSSLGLSQMGSASETWKPQSSSSLYKPSYPCQAICGNMWFAGVAGGRCQR